MAISPQVMWMFLVALIVTLFVPILLLIILGCAKKIQGMPLALGFASFFVSQILLRIPLLQQCAGQEWYQTLAASSPVLVGLMLAFTAGLFEESARLGGVALLGPRKPSFPGGPLRSGYRTWKGALSFGLGHAFCEMILLVGLTHLNNLIFCVMLGFGQETLASLIPADQLNLIVEQFAAVTPLTILAGILERLSAVLFHLFATGLVFLAMAKKQWLLYPAAILCHTLFNCVALLPLGIWAIEGILFLMALVCAFFFWKSRKWFPQTIPVQPSPLA